MTEAMADPIGTFDPELLPHSGTARLLTEIVRSGRDFVEAIGRIPAAHPLATSECAPCFLGLELGAQAAAALEALSRCTATGDRAPRAGYLVRVREAAFLISDLPIDTPLFVVAHLEGAAPPLAMYRISVAVDGIEFLQARLSTYGAT
jgi:predicted hotdog family 3-hydroxylacyl-ACP dehydratase